MNKDLFQGWWRRTHLLIVPLEGRPLSNFIRDNCRLQTLTMLLKTRLQKQKSTAISLPFLWKDALNLSYAPVTETTFQPCAWNLIPAWAFAVMPNALQIEEQRQVCVRSHIRVWWQGPGPPRARWLLAPPDPCALPSHVRSRQDSLLQLQSRAQLYFRLTAGGKKLDLAAIRTALSAPLPTASLPLLDRI